jgi:hypothetical protein
MINMIARRLKVNEDIGKIPLKNEWDKEQRR